jgi:hypothetical protein
MDARRSVEHFAPNMNSRASAQIVSAMESRQLADHSVSLRNTRLSTDNLLTERNSRISVERISFARIVSDKRTVFKQHAPDRLATRKLMARASNRAVFSERRVSRPETVPIIHLTPKAPEYHSTVRMSNVRYIKMTREHIPHNRALDHGFRLSERRSGNMVYRTLKSESFANIGLPVETLQKSVINFRPAAYSNWSDKVTEYVTSALASLAVIWPALTAWKASVLEHLASLDVALEFSPKMHHFNSFFAEKVKFCNVSCIVSGFSKSI